MVTQRKALVQNEWELVARQSLLSGRQAYTEFRLQTRRGTGPGRGLSLAHQEPSLETRETRSTFEPHRCLSKKRNTEREKKNHRGRGSSCALCL